MSIKYIIEHQGKELGGLPPIYIDDTIDTLKRKIILAMKQDIPYDGIYLFGIKRVEFTPERVFEVITQGGTLDLTHERLSAFLSNYVKKKSVKDEKAVYTLTDLYELRLDHPQLMKFPIGIAATGHKRLPFYFPADPMTNYMDPFLLKYAENMVSTQSGSLLMDLGDLNENKIFMVMADDIFDKSTQATNIIKVYYPFLEKVGLITKVEYEKKREKLIAQNKKFLSTSVLKSYESVDLFHEIADNEETAKVYSGIKSIDFLLNQKREMVLPLEILFKVIHATREHPFVKFNPNTQQESLVRLFTESQTIIGDKIPFLSKSMIMNLIKSVARKNALGIYICENMVCSIYPNGSVQIICEFDEVIELDDVVERIRILVNPVLEQIQKYVERSGINFDLFNGFENTELKNMNYTMTTVFNKKFTLTPIMSCVSSVFNVSQSNLAKEGGIQMRFKRVTNYNEMDAIDAFMRNAINQGNLRESVISMISDNFNLTDEEANAKYVEFIGEEEVKLGMSENMKLRIRDNPGFRTSIEKEKFKNVLNISIDIEENIKYLEVVPIFLKALVEMGQGLYSDKTKAICTRKAIVKDIVAPEILTPSELPFAENKTPVIEEGEELVFDDEGDDDMLDALLMGSDYEDEDEDEDDEGGENVMIGGANEGDEDKVTSIDITGMPLANPNPFSKRMEDRDQKLFLKKKQGKFNAYSRMCASNMRRQPVILTEEEKERIDREQPGSYTHSIKYGSDPKKPYYYICPRYWSFTENTSLTDEEVEKRKRGPISVNDPVFYKDGEEEIRGIATEVEDDRIKIKITGKKGGEEWQPRDKVLKDIIISPDAKKVPKGQTIYEFAVSKGARAYSDFIDADGNYITHYPGFISGDKHPEGLCMPCCYKSWDGDEQIRRRAKCKQDHDGAPKKAIPTKREYSAQQKDYIKGHDKFPLEQGRMGYLPIEIQFFFQEDAKQYQVSELDTSLKDDAITLLRMGVESSPNQSFISCIATAYSDTTDDEIKKRVEQRLQAVKNKKKHVRKDKTKGELQEEERLLKLQLREKATPSIKKMREIIAGLVSIDNFSNFQNGNLVTEFYPGNVDDIDIDDYSDSVLYKQLDTSDVHQVYYFERLIAAYENFQKFLQSDDSVIDYQYLWDIITSPHPDLFPSGINLVILEIPEDDVTSNVNVICPTNHYAKKGYNTLKRTLILVKKNDFFEPVYLYNNIEGEVKRYLFREQNLLGKPNIKIVLSKIRKFMNESCKPLNSMPKEYTYKDNLTLDEIKTILERHNIEITALEIHYNGKAIGVHIRHPDGDEGYIPCYPSNYEVTPDMPIIFMDGKDTKNRMGYEDTVEFLRKTNKSTKIPCAPRCKVIEDNLIVGIITETNQLVMLDNPAELREGEDEDVSLDVCSVKPYEQASKVSVSDQGFDTERVRFMNALQREKRYFNDFRNLSRIQLNKIGNISIKDTIVNTIRKEDQDSLRSYQDSIEKIVLELRKLLRGIIEFVDHVNVEEHKYPKTNGLTGSDNEEFYYIRLADELLRFQRIQLFMLETNKYLSFSEVNYQVNDDEMLLIESMITQDFFQGLKAHTRSNFVHFNTYDTAMPIKTFPYSDKLAIQTKCGIKMRTTLTEGENKFLDPLFSFYDYNPKSKEKRNTVCTYDIILTILENEKRRSKKSKVHEIQDLRAQTLKEILIERYNEYDENKVLSCLNKEGKEQWVRSIRGGKITLEQYITSYQYAFTMLDLWMLADYFGIPIIFYGQFRIPFNNEKAFANIVKKNMRRFYIIRVYKPIINTLPHYNLLVDPKKSIYIDIYDNPTLLTRLLTVASHLGKPPIRISEYIEK